MNASVLPLSLLTTMTWGGSLHSILKLVAEMVHSCVTSCTYNMNVVLSMYNTSSFDANCTFYVG